MPLFKSKKKAEAQAPESEAHQGYNQYYNRDRSGIEAGRGDRPVADTNAGQNDGVGAGQQRAVNRDVGDARGARHGQVFDDNTTHQQGATGRHHGGGRDRTEGRVEQHVGELVGSQALQAHGAQKAQEANAIKEQSAELAEAERLEREAMMRRERAVAAGAHPANKNPGAGWSDGPAMAGGHLGRA